MKGGIAMKKGAVSLLVAFVPLYQQCQDQLKKDPKNAEAKKLCDKGMKLYREGKQEEAIKTIQEGLTKFK